MPDKITDKELEQLVRLYKTAAHPIDIAIYKAVKELQKYREYADVDDMDEVMERWMVLEVDKE